MYIDASDECWCAALTHRDVAGRTLWGIRIVATGFSDEATRWCAFERECYAVKEGYVAVPKRITGFTVVMCFDHKNIERAESALAFPRASNKW